MTVTLVLRSCVMLTFLTVFLTSAPAQMSGITEYKFGDYTFKMMSNDQAGQMWEGMKVLGSIYTANGQQQFVPVVPEPEASKARKAFEDWKASGKTGSIEAPKVPVRFEADGSAVVPLQDGTVVSFKPAYVDVNQPNGLAILPGQRPVTNVRFLLKGPGFGKELFGNHTNIFIDGKESDFGAGFGGGKRKAGKERLYLLKPLVDGPVTTAANLASSDPNKPANALNYRTALNEVEKRVDYRF